MQQAMERTTSWNSTKDDDFGMEWDGDLLRVDLDHSLLETTALLLEQEQAHGQLQQPTQPPFDTPIMDSHVAGTVPMAPSPQPKLRQGSAAAACTGAGGLGGLQPLGAEYSSHSRPQHSQPPLARTTSGGSNSTHRVRKFVIGGGAFAAAQQQCPVTPVPAVTPLSVPAPGAVEVPAPLTNETEKENAGFPSSSDCSGSNAGATASRSAGKAERKRSERINVRLLPMNAATETRIRRAGYNPKLELSTPLTKKVGFFLGHLAAKWARVPGIGSLRLRLTATAARQPHHSELEESVQLRALSAHFKVPKAQAPSAACMLQLAYVLKAEAEEEEQQQGGAAGHGGLAWQPEENSLFDAFAASGVLEQLPPPSMSAGAGAAASRAGKADSLLEALPPAEVLAADAAAPVQASASASAVVPQQQQQQQQQQPKPKPKPKQQQPKPKLQQRMEHTTGFGASASSVVTAAATVVTVHVPRRKKRPAPTGGEASQPQQPQQSLGRLLPCSSSSSLEGASSSGGMGGLPVTVSSSSLASSNSASGSGGPDRKRRRIRPTPVPAGEAAAAASSPSFFQAAVGVSSSSGYASSASSSSSGSHSDNSR